MFLPGQAHDGLGRGAFEYFRGLWREWQLAKRLGQDFRVDKNVFVVFTKMRFKLAVMPYAALIQCVDSSCNLRCGYCFKGLCDAVVID